MLLPYLNLVVHGHLHEEQLGWLDNNAERAAADISKLIVIVVLSAGGALRRGLGHRRRRGFRHPVIRRFLRRKLVPLPLAVPGLASGMEAASAMLGPVGGAGAAERLTTPERAAVEAEALAAIAATAEAKLNAEQAQRARR